MNVDNLKQWYLKNRNKLKITQKWYYKIPIIGKYIKQKHENRKYNLMEELYENINEVIVKEIKRQVSSEDSCSYIKNLYDAIAKDRMNYGKPNWNEIIRTGGDSYGS